MVGGGFRTPGACGHIALRACDRATDYDGFMKLDAFDIGPISLSKTTTATWSHANCPNTHSRQNVR